MRKVLTALLLFLASNAAAQVDNGYQCKLSCQSYGETCFNEQQSCAISQPPAVQSNVCMPSREDLICRLDKNKPEASNVFNDYRPQPQSTPEKREEANRNLMFLSNSL